MRTRSQDFDIVSTLGKGTYGACYRVRRKEDGEILVIKVVSLEGLSTKDRNETLNEARLMQKLQHKNVVRYCESWCEAECLYIVMQYYGGGDLGRLIKRHRGHVPEQEVWKHLIDIAQGLAYIHERRILHRDIKASNVFLNGDLAVIGDLGLGRVLGPNTAMAYSQVGTPLYFSPELCEEQPYDYKSDVWSFGCLIYELAAGLPPFIASNQLALARKIVSDPPPSLPRMYSRELQSLIHVMLEKKPATRPSMLDILSHPSVSARIQIYEMKIEYRTLEEGLIKEYQKKKVELEGQFNSWKKEISSEFQSRLGAAKRGSGEESSSRKEREILLQRARDAEQMARKANEERSSLQRKLFACESELRGLQATMAKAESESGRRSKELQDAKSKLHEEENANVGLRKQLIAEKEMSTKLGVQLQLLEERHSAALVSSGCQTDAVHSEKVYVNGDTPSGQLDASLSWLTPPYQSPASPPIPENSNPAEKGDQSNQTTLTPGSEAAQCLQPFKDLPGGIPVSPWQGSSPFQNPFVDEGSDQIEEKANEKIPAVQSESPTCETPTVAQIRKMVARDLPTSIRSAPTTPYRQMTEEILARQTATPQAPCTRYSELPTHQLANHTDAQGWQSGVRTRHCHPVSPAQQKPNSSHPQLPNGWSSLRDISRETGNRCVEDRFRHPGSAKPEVSRRGDRPSKKARPSEGVKTMQPDHHEARMRERVPGLEQDMGSLDTANDGKPTPLTCLLHWKKGSHRPGQPKSKQFINQLSWGNKERYSVPAGGGNNLGILFKTRKGVKESPTVRRMWARLRATTRFERMDLYRQRKLQTRAGGSSWYLIQAVWGVNCGASRDVAEITIEFISPNTVEELLVVKHNDALQSIMRGAAQTTRSKAGSGDCPSDIRSEVPNNSPPTPMKPRMRESFSLHSDKGFAADNGASRPEQPRSAEILGAHDTASALNMTVHSSNRQHTAQGINKGDHAREESLEGIDVKLYPDVRAMPVTESLSWPLRPDQVQQIQRQVGNEPEAKQGPQHNSRVDSVESNAGIPQADMGMLMDNLSRTLASVEQNLQSQPTPSRADWSEVYQGKENLKFAGGMSRADKQAASSRSAHVEDPFQATKYHTAKPTRLPSTRNFDEDLPGTPIADRFMDGLGTPFSTPYREGSVDPLRVAGPRRRATDAEALQHQAQQLQYQLRVACEMLSSPLKPDEDGQHNP